MKEARRFGPPTRIGCTVSRLHEWRRETSVRKVGYAKPAAEMLHCMCDRLLAPRCSPRGELWCGLLESLPDRSCRARTDARDCGLSFASIWGGDRARPLHD